MTQYDLALSIAGLRPGETPFLQPLGADQETARLKSEVERIAAREELSVARICETFLLAGSDLYKRPGSRFLQQLIGRLSVKSVD